MNNYQSRPLGLRDLKSAAKQLKEELATLDLSRVQLSLCHEIVDRLAPPSGQAQKGHHRHIPAPVESERDLVSLSSGESADHFLTLGIQSHQEGILGPIKNWVQPHQEVHWTHEGALRHALLFASPGAGGTEALLTMASSAMDKGCGVFFLDAKGFDQCHEKAKSHAYALGQLERLRLVNLSGGAGHTYNPFAKGSPDDLKEVLYMALRSTLQPVETPVVEQLKNALSVMMDYLVWGRDTRRWGLDLDKVGDGLSFDGVWSAWKDVSAPPDIQKRLRDFIQSLSPLEDEAQARRVYRPLEIAVVDEIIKPASAAFASTMQAIQDGKRWRLPDLDVVSALKKKQWVFWSFPSSEKSMPWTMLPARLALAELSHYAPSLSEVRAPRVTALVIANELGACASRDLLKPLMSWGLRKGISCVLSDFDYPAIKKGEGMHEIVSLCCTKIFMKMEGPYEDDVSSANVQPIIPLSLAASFGRLNDQRKGEAHIIAKSTLYKVNMRYYHFNGFDGTATLNIAGYQGQDVRSNSLSRQASILHQRLQEDDAMPENLSWCQETLARMLGYTHWHEVVNRH